MSNGWMDSELEVDLSRGNIESRESDANVNETYLGGRGICSKIFWDRVPPKVSAFSPDNLLVFGTGVLEGTIVPAANRTILVTKSPLTDLMTYNSAGGFWGPELKHSGFNTLIVSGKSPTPVYIWINDGKVEIRDATHLWGKDTFETQKVIRDELKNKNVQVLCIGVAGENKVYSASIEHSVGCSLSRAGVGAVMGDKNLKAIAVYGTRDVNVARPMELNGLCNEIFERADKVIEFVNDISHNQTAGMLGYCLYGNLDEMQPWNGGDANADFLARSRAVRTACYNCHIACKRAVHLGGSRPFFMKCASPFTFIPPFKIQDFEFNAKCYALAEKYGFDVISLAGVCAFAIDLYQKGFLNKEDTDGMHLEYGKPEVAWFLIEKIVRREGIGNILANGVYKAAQLIGKGAEEYAFHINKLEPLTEPLQFPWLAMVGILSDRQDVLRVVTYVPQHLPDEPEEFRKWYAESVYWPYPQEWKKYAEAPFDPTGGDWERQSKMINYDRTSITISDCTGLCQFWTGFYKFSPIRDWDQARLVSYSTGLDVDQSAVTKCAHRVSNLVRAYNAILGERKTVDVIPARFFRQAAGPYPPLNKDNLRKVVEEVHKLSGCNQEGIPTKKTLDELGLSYVAQELERRGILPGEH